MNDLWGALNDFSDRIVRTVAPAHQDDRQDHHARHARPLPQVQLPGLRPLHQDVDLAIAGDGEASLPALTEAVKQLVDDGRKSAFEARGKKLAAGAARHDRAGEVRRHHRLGLRARSPPARMCAEVYAQIKDEDWSLVGNAHPQHLAASAVELRQAVPAGTAARAAPASATTRRPRSARRSPTSGTAGSRVDVQRRRRPHVRAGDAVDGGAPPHPDPLHRAQQPRLSPGVHVPAGDGEPARPRHREDATSAPRSRIRTSTTPRWRAASASMARGRSPIRTISRRRSSAPSRWSRAASRR